MIMLTLASTLVLGLVADQPLSCAATGEPASAKVSAVDYKGTRYVFCCDGCPQKFAKNPTATLKNPELKGKTVGYFLYDPVSHTKIDGAESKASMDVNGVRYFFGSEANRKTFASNVKKYTTMPTKEVVYCPVAKEKLDGYAGAYAYVDYKDVRYYVCCPDCFPKMSATPQKYAPGVKKMIATPKSIMIKPGQVPVSYCKDEK